MASGIMGQRGRASEFASGLVAMGGGRLPIGWMRALSGASLVVPYYHMVSNCSVPHVSQLYRFRTVAEFAADVEFLLRHFKPVSLQDIVDGLNGQRSLRGPCFHLTFDDGFSEMHDVVAPILVRAGAPATFFLNTAVLDGAGITHHNALSVLADRLEAGGSHPKKAVARRLESILPAADADGTLRGRILSIRHGHYSLVPAVAAAMEVNLDEYVAETRPYLSSDQIVRMLAMGFSIGSHSHDHPLYADIPLAQQLAQTRQSVQLLDSRFGLELKAFAFPHTDTGVGPAFFTTVFSEHLLDVSFGTAGLVDHFHPRNIERVSMEKTSAPAAQILGRQFARAVYFKLRARIVPRNHQPAVC